jgi:hypothetical protein
LLLVVSACRTSAEPPKPERHDGPRATESRANASGQAASALAKNDARGSVDAIPTASNTEVARALIEIRERMSLAAPSPRPRHLAFGKGFVLQLRASEALLLDSSDGRELARMPVAAPRATVALPAGSVLVAALDASYRFDPGQKRPHDLARLSLLPGFVVEPRRDTQDLIWVLQAPLKRIQRYALEPDAGLGLESERELEHYDGGPFTTLRDGSFLYTARSGSALVHRAGFGGPKALDFPGDVGAIWRLAAADRIDRAWVATSSGVVLLVELGVRLKVVRMIRTGLAPFDFAATASHFALVSLTERSTEPRRFTLSVYSGAGLQLYSHDLGGSEPIASSDWVARIVADKELVLGEAPPRVGIGGPSLLRVFELASGKEMFAR